jgi:hypothetical protein
MITLKLQGRAPTIRDQQRAGMARSFNRYASLDFEEARSIVDSRQQVGPATPLAALSILQPDKLAERERLRHWQLVAEFNRYGFCESKNYGTPFVGDAFGYGQTIEVNL